MNTIPRKLGRYGIIREIGRGAMGVVYKAYDPIIEREVAIKAIQISFQVTPEEKNVYISRFFREAKAAGKLSHSNIVTIYDVDEDKETGTPFIVMEFLEGTTMQEIISSGILLPIEDVNHLITQLADALSYAHSEGIVHRDIKSANVLVLPGMKVKIMDFGIARLPSSDLTKSGQFMGTPNYMSPEQIEGKIQVDGRSDLFSLGVIFYMLLTGERPFSGESFNTVSYKIVHMDPIPPRTLNPAVPDIYNRMLSRLLAKDPADRYSTGGELVAELKKLNVPEVTELEEVKDLVPEETYPPRLERVSSMRDTLPQPQTMTFAKSSGRRFVTFSAIFLLFLALAAVSFYFFKISSQKTPPQPIASRPQPDPLQVISRQNTIRIKWDLAMGYHQSGMYDKTIEELNSIIQLDPGNEEAKKFLELVKQTKTEAEKKNQVPVVEKSPPIQPVSKPPKIVQKKITPPPAPPPVEEPKMASISMEFEHNFPSGFFYIYLDGKLIYQANLTGEEKKVFLFKNYKGKLTGSLHLPLGEANLTFLVVSKDLGISISKKATAAITEAGPHSLRIKYLKAPQELELKWT